MQNYYFYVIKHIFGVNIFHYSQYLTILILQEVHPEIHYS